MTQDAAIRRASQQGRSAMHELVAAGVDDLVRIYQAAADEVRGRINAAVDNTDRESSLQALERLSPEVRAGAIWQTKASYFDQGLLTTGMIRSPLRAVEARSGATRRNAGPPWLFRESAQR